MNRRGTGVIFCMISAILYIAHYITTAIYLSSSQSWEKELFFMGMGYTGNALDILSIIALVIGIFYLVWAETDKRNN